LKVFDINGREIRTLINEFQRDGQYSLDFNAENLASGIYTFRLKAGDFVETKKMTLVK
jgi:5-hydroxyisourate hydrolase-like protein (transthyretin family)